MNRRGQGGGVISSSVGGGSLDLLLLVYGEWRVGEGTTDPAPRGLTEALQERKWRGVVDEGLMFVI